MALFETIFDVAYLIGVVTIGIMILCKAKGDKEHSMFGAMAVILGCGDAFHLVPRVISLWTENGFDKNAAMLGIGQLITSVTMTIFYILLYYIWRERYHIKGQSTLSYTILGLAALRLIFCFLPQNAWTSKDAPLSFGILRNIPFALMGIIIIVLFYKQAKAHNDKAFKSMWLAITLSFAFYVPVVLFAGIFPPVGALMMPKTLAYVWIVIMGYSSMKQGDKK